MLISDIPLHIKATARSKGNDESRLFLYKCHPWAPHKFGSGPCASRSQEKDAGKVEDFRQKLFDIEILKVCCQVREEASTVLLQSNTLHFASDTDLSSFIRNIGWRSNQMRSVRLDLGEDELMGKADEDGSFTNDRLVGLAFVKKFVKACPGIENVSIRARIGESVDVLHQDQCKALLRRMVLYAAIEPKIGHVEVFWYRLSGIEGSETECAMGDMTEQLGRDATKMLKKGGFDYETEAAKEVFEQTQMALLMFGGDSTEQLLEGIY